MHATQEAFTYTQGDRSAVAAGRGGAENNTCFTDGPIRWLDGSGKTDQTNWSNKNCDTGLMAELTALRELLAGEEALEEGCGNMALLEVGVVEDTFVQRDSGLNALDDELVEGPAHSGKGFLPVSPMGNDFSDHRVVERDNHHVRFHRRIDAHTEPARRVIPGDHSRTGREPLRIFCINATFKTVPAELDVLLFEREGLPIRKPDLLLDEIDAGHHFGDRMLHLDPSVHLHEEEVVVFVEQKLHGPNIPVLHGFDGFNGDATDLPSKFFVDGGRGCFFEKFLMPALN